MESSRHDHVRARDKFAMGFLLMAVTLSCAAVLACSARPVEGGPGNRIYTEAGWDAAAGKMLLLGGQVSNSVVPVDSWTWSPSERAWSSIASIPGDFSTGSMEWYASASTMVCFVGTRWKTLDTKTVQNVSETWVYDASKDRWNQLQTKGTPSPGLLGCRVAYSTKAERLVLFGGFVVTGSIGYRNETWVLDLAALTWTRMEPPESPPGRNYFQMAYDAGADRFVVFGSDFYEELDTGTWIYDLGTNTWFKAGGNAMPEPVVYSKLVYIPELAGCLMFGGAEGKNEKPRDGTWLFTMADGWTELSSPNRPSARGWHAMAWDPISKRAWLYGGGMKRNMATKELWYWDLGKRDWFPVERGG